MFAVREEVLVLKEQIKELLEKNSQLEYENSVLRNGASQETLDTLANLQPVTNAGQAQSSSS
jgi:regulator of replication initiation timing